MMFAPLLAKLYHTSHENSILSRSANIDFLGFLAVGLREPGLGGMLDYWNAEPGNRQDIPFQFQIVQSFAMCYNKQVLEDSKNGYLQHCQNKQIIPFF